MEQSRNVPDSLRNIGDVDMHLQVYIVQENRCREQIIFRLQSSICFSYLVYLMNATSGAGIQSNPNVCCSLPLRVRG